MNQAELHELWSRTLRSERPGIHDFERLAAAVVEVHESGHPQFRQHIKNRSKRVTERTGQAFDPDNFDIAMARTFVADELGLSGWDKLADFLRDASENRPILFQYAVAALWRGDFSALESAVGGPDASI